jgi:hypothetical protein
LEVGALVVDALGDAAIGLLLWLREGVLDLPTVLDPTGAQGPAQHGTVERPDSCGVGDGVGEVGEIAMSGRGCRSADRPAVPERAEFRMRYGALFTSRRIHASATVSVSVVLESTRQRPRAEVDATEPDDRAELRAQWRALPKSIRPEEWITGTGVKHVSDSLLIAEEQRLPEGYYPCGS